MSTARTWIGIGARGLVGTAAVWAAASCGTEAGGVAPPEAAASSVAGGNAQIGTVGEALPTPLSVRVVDEAGQPFAGAQVRWATEGAGGSLSPATSSTDGSGTATSVWTLGEVAGPQGATAAVSGLPTVTFEAMGTAGPAVEVTVAPGAAVIDALESTLGLEAVRRDAFGNPVPGGSFDWTSGDETVATVDEAGVVTAVGPGGTDITARVDALSGSATVEVMQVAATVVLEPEALELALGAEEVLGVNAADANGRPIADPMVVWSSGDEGVATVDASGLVTAVALGETTITASSGAVSAEATVTVVEIPDDFRAESDVALDGDVEVGAFTVPAGVTVTLTADATITAHGPVEIDGTLTGTCTEIGLRGREGLTVRGVVDQGCAADPGGDPPGMDLQVEGPIELDGVVFRVAGAFLLANGPALAGGSPAGTAAAFGERAGAFEEPAGCVFADVGVERFGDRARAAEGSPRGEDGRPGLPMRIHCGGDLTLERNTYFVGHDAEWGGHGTSVGISAPPAVGGDGGTGGDVFVEVDGDLVVRGNLRVFTGDGGQGGDALGEGGPRIEAFGGHGGRAGLPYLRVTGEVISEGEGEVVLSIGPAGWGGLAEARGYDGANAGVAPAEPGSDAHAVGGTGGALGLEGGIDVVGGLVDAAVVASANIVVRKTTGLNTAGGAGSASSFAGRGGDGNVMFPDGGRGGTPSGRGGMGGSVFIVDNTAGTVVQLESLRPADGSLWRINGGNGGTGADRCNPVAGGGAGGSAGLPSGMGGRPGVDVFGASGGAQPGAVLVGRSNGFGPDVPSLVGGDGGDGDLPGLAGDAGDLEGVNGIGPIEIGEGSLLPGTPGGPCGGVFPAEDDLIGVTWTLTYTLNTDGCGFGSAPSGVSAVLDRVPGLGLTWVPAIGWPSPGAYDPSVGVFEGDSGIRAGGPIYARDRWTIQFQADGTFQAVVRATLHSGPAGPATCETTMDVVGTVGGSG